jgi:hypothetical protein
MGSDLAHFDSCNNFSKRWWAILRLPQGFGDLKITRVRQLPIYQD